MYIAHPIIIRIVSVFTRVLRATKKNVEMHMYMATIHRRY